jgi:hypothetical protein
MTNILPCKCKHAYQDERYGNGLRVHNHAPKVHSGAGGWRCTVCEDVKPMASKAGGSGGQAAPKSAAKKARKQAEKRKSPAARPVRPTNQRGTR